MIKYARTVLAAMTVALVVAPTLAAAAVSDDPEPVLGAIGDGPDPLGFGVISDTPDPISGVISADPVSFACIIDGPEPFGASIEDDPRGITIYFLVWVSR